jgi:hypothetical protein
MFALLSAIALLLHLLGADIDVDLLVLAAMLFALHFAFDVAIPLPARRHKES